MAFKPMKIDGVPVKDANEKITVIITKADVRAGAAKKSDACAAARALCRQEQCEAAKVHVSRAYIKKNGKWLRFNVPPPMRNEIIAFDRGGEFAPGEYTLTPLQPSVRLGADKRRQEGKRGPDSRKNHQSQGKAKRAYHVVHGVRARMENT